MSLLVVVLPAADAALPAPLQAALCAVPDGIEAVHAGHGPALAADVARLAPEAVLLYLPAGTAEAVCPAVADAVSAWGGEPPCALALLSGSLPPEAHAALVALGVAAWAPAASAGDPAELAALLARAKARHAREQAWRDRWRQARAELDDRKWVERAKGHLMSARDIGEDDAFRLLRGAAMHANLKLAEVARSVLQGAQWAEAVNRAGQLRMLAQRVARLAAQSVAGVEARQARALRGASAQRVRENLDHLAALELDAGARQALADAREAWRALGAAFEPGTGLTRAALAGVDERAEALTGAADSLVEALQAHAGRQALRIVNLCGRQRMRVHRLAKDALLAVLVPDAALAALHAQRVGRTMDDFEAALRELDAAPLSSPDIRAALASARDEWLRLVRGAQQASRAEGQAELVRASEQLADTFDRLTASYEHSLQVIMA